MKTLELGNVQRHIQPTYPLKAIGGLQGHYKRLEIPSTNRGGHINSFSVGNNKRK